MKKLIQSASLIGTTEIALVFVSIIRNKYLAVRIGPEGFGLYGVLNSFFIFASVFTASWLANATIKYIAEYQGNKESLQKLYNYTLSIASVSSIFLTLMFFVFQSIIKKYFLSSDVIFLYFALFNATFVFKSVNIVFANVLQGLKLIKKIVRIRIINSAIEFISIIIFVYFFDLTGFFISIVFSTIFSTIVYWSEIRKVFTTKIVIPQFGNRILKKLLVFGGAAFILNLLSMLSNYILRVVVLRETDLATTGLLQVSLVLMGMLGVVNRGSHFYFFPNVSRKMHIKERNSETNEYLRFTLLTSSFISVIAILFVPTLILILYSSKFLSLSTVFYWFVIAGFLANLANAFHTNMMGLGFVKSFTGIGIFGWAILVLTPIIAVGKYGISSVAMGYILSYLATIPVLYWYLYKIALLRIHIKVITCFLISIIMIGGAIYFMSSTLLLKLVWCLTSLGLASVMIKKDEYQRLYDMFRKA
ncbi:oligosaccharide flippase family protein [candidate division KSB1 bacterium]|nr:oligosaccharide flippase family protein [candidate division KSB1 bacterium]